MGSTTQRMNAKPNAFTKRSIPASQQISALNGPEKGMTGNS